MNESKVEKLRLIDQAFKDADKTFDDSDRDISVFQEIVNVFQPLPQKLQQKKDSESDYVPTDEELEDIQGLLIGLFDDIPIDNDSDGIINTTDECPDEYGSILNSGCPIASDEIPFHTQFMAIPIVHAVSSISLNSSSECHMVSFTNPFDGSTIEVSSHCQILESVSSILSVVLLVAWSLLGLRIFLYEPKERGGHS